MIDPFTNVSQSVAPPAGVTRGQHSRSTQHSQRTQPGPKTQSSRKTQPGQRTYGSTAHRDEKIGLVPFLFGVAGVEEIPGVALTHLLVDLGMTTTAARGQLARMRRDGQLDAARAGRGVRYRLAGPLAESFHRVGPGPRTVSPWSGQFHGLLYQVPETQRAYRDRLRRVAVLLGYGLLQQGVLIAVDDLRDQLVPVLDDAPPGCRVYSATIGMKAGEAAETAGRAWDLPSVADAFRRHLVSLRRALAAEVDRPPTAATLRAIACLLNAPFVDLVRDPGLPAELLPSDWPRRELDDAMAQIARLYAPPAARYVRQLIGAAPPAAQMLDNGRSAHHDRQLGAGLI